MRLGMFGGRLVTEIATIKPPYRSGGSNHVILGANS
jgi:hypothetical protein